VVIKCFTVKLIHSREGKKEGKPQTFMRNPERLAEFLSAKMKESNLTAQDVVRLSGKRISAGTVWNVLNGRVRNIETETLQAFARAVQVSEDELFEEAYGRRLSGADDPNELKLGIWYRNLPPDSQRDVMIVVGALHREHAVKPVEKIDRAARKKKRSRAA
jgi:transcriptional regulator with XRE-family HTH domain